MSVFKNQSQSGLTASVLYFLDMAVPFTSAASEQIQAATTPQGFPLNVRGAWSDLVSPRIRITGGCADIPWSVDAIPLRSIAGNTNLVNPIYFYRKPYTLDRQVTLRGDLINDASEAAGNIVFLCERPDLEKQIQVSDRRIYWLMINLGLTGGATATGEIESLPMDKPVLIYGASSSSTGALIRISDTSLNTSWSSGKLPVGAFAGIQASGNPQPVIRYPKPYFLPAQATIRVEWTNAGAESGKYLIFACERLS